MNAPMDRLEEMDAEWMDAALGPRPDDGRIDERDWEAWHAFSTDPWVKCRHTGDRFEGRCAVCGETVDRDAGQRAAIAHQALETARRSERLNRIIVANGWAIIGLAAASVALQAIGMWG